MTQKIRIAAKEIHKLNKVDLCDLISTVDDITTKQWGKFPNKFIEKTVKKSSYISLAYVDDDLAGYCLVSCKRLIKQDVFYIEFTVVKKEYQSNSLMSSLTIAALKKLFVKYFHRLMSSRFEVMFVTPNIRTLVKIARHADFIYPNPFKADSDGKVEKADIQTWKMAKRLIEKSYNPNRKIDREGLVLHGSYFDCPWLIYEGDSIPWHRDDKINMFAKRYLGYGNKEDKEFIVRARLGYKLFLKLLNNR